MAGNYNLKALPKRILYNIVASVSIYAIGQIGKYASKSINNLVEKRKQANKKISNDLESKTKGQE